MLSFLRRHFLTGLLAITPLAITIWSLWHIYNLVNVWVQPWMKRIPGLWDIYPEFVLTLMGFTVFALAITLVGMFTRNLIGMAFFRLVDRFFTRIPVVKSLFSATKQLSEVFLQGRRTAFQKVVLFQYPREGLFSIGFVTRDETGENMVNVFLPTTPNPTSGFLLLVPKADVRVLDIPVEEAIKLIVSGGAIMTEKQAECMRDMSTQLQAGSTGLKFGEESEND